MAPTRRSRLEEAGIALLAMLTVLGGAIRGLGETARSEPDSLDADTQKSKSGTRAIPVPLEPQSQCPPRRGWLVTRKWHMSEISRDYQARVTGFAPFTEWKFMNIEFDGFRAPECRLQEAKARYDQFFNKQTGQPKHFFRIFGVPRIFNQARIQSEIAAANPPARLTWYFMQPISHEYFSKAFAHQKLLIESLLYP
jgi:hypothetical protein